MRQVDVAIGIILRDGKILVCRRRNVGHLAGYWEFPGGKCEPNESPVDALHREVAEEVGLSILPVEALPPVEHDYPEVRLRIHAFACRHAAGEAQPLAAEELRWVDPLELSQIRFPEANGPLLEKITAWLAATAANPGPAEG